MASLTSTTSLPAPLGDYPEPDDVPLSAVSDRLNLLQATRLQPLPTLRVWAR